MGRPGPDAAPKPPVGSTIRILRDEQELSEALHRAAAAEKRIEQQVRDQVAHRYGHYSSADRTSEPTPLRPVSRPGPWPRGGDAA